MGCSKEQGDEGSGVDWSSECVYMEKGGKVVGGVVMYGFVDCQGKFVFNMVGDWDPVYLFEERCNGIRGTTGK